MSRKFGHSGLPSVLEPAAVLPASARCHTQRAMRGSSFLTGMPITRMVAAQSSWSATPLGRSAVACFDGPRKCLRGATSVRVVMIRVPSTSKKVASMIVGGSRATEGDTTGKIAGVVATAGVAKERPTLNARTGALR